MVYVEFFFTYAILKKPILNSITQELKHCRLMQEVIWITRTMCLKLSC